MTILSVIRDVSMAVGLARPSAVFGSTDRQWQEMQTVANEAAAVIAKAFDWQKLRRLHTQTGTSLAGSFALPSDFARMTRSGSVWTSRWRAPAHQVLSLDDWMEYTDFSGPIGGGAWTVYGGSLHFLPILGAGETLKFFYITNRIISGPVENPGLTKVAFTNDGDTFMLSERILKLCIVYLWKQLKGLDFAAELADYEQAVHLEMKDDRGSQPVVTGNTGLRRASSNVWPGSVSG